MKPITPINNNGAIQLKFAVIGHCYSFNPVKGGQYSDKTDLAKAQMVATQIQNDILADNFDSTLVKYKPRIPVSPSKEAVLPQVVYVETLLEVWDAWIASLNMSEASKANHPKVIRRMISKAAPSTTSTEWFVSQDISANTFNPRLGYLKSCSKWALGKNLIEVNLFENIKSRKQTKPEIKPFTLNEMKLILKEFEYRFDRIGSISRGNRKKEGKQGRRNIVK